MKLFADMDPDLNSPERLNVFMSNIPSNSFIIWLQNYPEYILQTKTPIEVPI
jgi:hypothetical protein